MAAPNMHDPFFADIVAVFPKNAWQTNVVNNSNILGNGKLYHYFSLCSECADYHRRTNRSYLLFTPNSPSELCP